MRSLKRRAKLLTTKLNALQSELKTSKEIVEEANAEIQKLYNERIQQAPEPEKTPEQSKEKSLLTETQETTTSIQELTSTLSALASAGNQHE